MASSERWINRGMMEKARQDLETNITIEAKQKNTWVTGKYKPRGEHDIIRLRSPTEDTICLNYSIIIVRRTFGSGFIEPLKFMTIIWGVLTMISNYHYLSRTNFLKRSFSYRVQGAMAWNQENPSIWTTETRFYEPTRLSTRTLVFTKTAGCHNLVEVVVV